MAGARGIIAAGRRQPVVTADYTFGLPANSTCTFEGADASVGVEFTVDTAGYITGLIYNRCSSAPSTVDANISDKAVSAFATPLRRETFTGLSAGRNLLIFTTPLAVDLTLTYVAWVYISTNSWVVNTNFYASQINNGPLHSPAVGSGGRYSIGANARPSSAHPDSFGVDVQVTV